MGVYAFAAVGTSGAKSKKHRNVLHNASGQKPETEKAWE